MFDRRRHSRSPEPSAERWVIPYADMLTLLFALFTLLYASSALDAEKAQQLADALRESFGSVPREQGTDTPAVLEGAPLDPAVTEEDQARENLAGRADRVQLDLLGQRVQELAQGQGDAGSGISARGSDEGLVISLADSLFFADQGAELPDSARAALARVAGLLEGVPNHVRVEGHTDGEPAVGFHSNWALSAARAVAVLEALAAEGVQAHRLSASGFADQRPLMSPDTPEGRRLNRRVDLVVLRAAGSEGGS